MSKRPSPAAYWRNAVRGGFSQLSNPISEGESGVFCEQVRGLYRKEKESRRREPAGPEPDHSLFVLAVAVFTCGRLESLEDILRNVPPQRHPARILLRSVDALLPLDEGISAWLKPDDVLQWLEKNGDRLVWNEAEETYVFRN